MKDKEEMAFVGLDASKETLAVVVTSDGRDGELRVSFFVQHFLENDSGRTAWQ